MGTITKELQAAADYLILKSDYDNRVITNKKLQKLVYYAQAWHLVFTSKPLFTDPIEAWMHGPAVKSLWQKYKKYGYSPIIDKPLAPTLPKGIDALLDEVWRVYGKYDADYLEGLTHSERPWLDARKGLDTDEMSSIEISTDSMKNYYTQLNVQKATI
jgi:uncharacterized phage-associated protein